MLPKINFRYSWVYDTKFRKKDINYPSLKSIFQKKKQYKEEWKKHSEKILKSISKISGLKWRGKIINYYLIFGANSFSDPLTIKIWSNKKYKTKTKFIDTITHELIHQITIQNLPEIKSAFMKNIEKYKDENRLTRNHILLHAIHKELYLTLFNKNRLNSDIKNSENYPPYKKAWEIVEKEGHKNIITDFKKRIKTKANNK